MRSPGVRAYDTEARFADVSVFGNSEFDGQTRIYDCFGTGIQITELAEYFVSVEERVVAIVIKIGIYEVVLQRLACAGVIALECHGNLLALVEDELVVSSKVVLVGRVAFQRVGCYCVVEVLCSAFSNNLLNPDVLDTVF